MPAQGVRHSENNDSATEVLELLQIWILPESLGITPSYQQIAFKKTMPQFRLLASPDGQQDSVSIHQDVKLYTVAITDQQPFIYKVIPGRYLWLQMISGDIVVGDKKLLPGDGAAVSDEKQIKVVAKEPSEFLLFDLN